MSKLNPRGKAKPSVVTRNVEVDWFSKTVSANGNPQYAKPPEQLLFEIMTSCKFGSDTAFMSSAELMAKLHDAVTLCVRSANYGFIANLCVYARHEADMRTMPLVALVMFAKILREEGRTYPDMRRLVYSVIKRADEPLDLYANALSVFGGKEKIPQAMKKGVADSLNKFDEYQFQKYDRKTGLKFKDLLRIVHPHPKNKHQSTLFGKIMTGTLTVAKTHEVLISAAAEVAKEKGVTKEQAKAEAWGELLKEGKLGYMAAIRNAANIATTVDDSAFAEYLRLLRNPVAIKKSGIFPYQVFLPMALMDNGSLLTSAHLFVSRNGGQSDVVQKFLGLPAARKNLLISALSAAMDNSVSNLPDLGDEVTIYLDTSGSMRTVFLQALPLVAGLVKAMAGKRFALVGFDSQPKIITLNPEATVASLCNQLRTMFNGGTTNLLTASRLPASQLGFQPKTVLLVSDMQINQCSMGASVKSITAASPVFSGASTRIAVNVSAAESTCVLGDEWFNVAGYSDSIFDLISQGSQQQSFEITIAKYSKWRAS